MNPKMQVADAYAGDPPVYPCKTRGKDGLKMKILHVIDSLISVAGGPPVVAASLATAQSGLGHEVALAYHTIDPEQSVVDDGEVPGLSGLEHVALPRRDHRRAPSKYLSHGDDRRLLPHVERADVVHLHNIWEPVASVTGRLARMTKTPYLVTPHGMLHRWALSQRRLKKRLALALGKRRLLARASCLHLVSPQEREEIAALRLTTPGRVIPNGVWPDSIDAAPPAGAFRATLPAAAQNAPLALFLSRLHVKKGVDLLADVFKAAEAPEAHLVVVGPDGGMRSTLERRAHELGLADRVHLVGPLYGRAKFEALVDADVFVLPSRQEGHPVSVLEAMALGVPVVITEESHVPEAGQAGAGYVLPLDVKRLGGALGMLLRDATLRDEMGAKGRELVRSTFTWPTVAERAVEVYREFLPRAA